jgi:Uma2 family endonuclease
MSAVAHRTYTPEEYLNMEREAQYKSEYLDGRIYAMAGASREHNLLVASLLREIGIQVKGRRCEAYPSDMRVQVHDRNFYFYTYPDVVVTCGEPVFSDEKMDALTNPTVLFEVLSPSTEGYDRGRKFELYRKIESLQEFVLVAQDRAFVEHYVRSGSKWELSDISGLDDALRLESIQCELALRDIYDKVEFPAVAAEPIGDRTGAEGEELQR